MRKFGYILQFFVDKGENASQAVEIVNGACGADTARAHCVQFRLRRFRSGVFEGKDAPRRGGPVAENVHNSTELIEVDQHASSRIIAQGRQVDHKTVSNHLRKHFTQNYGFIFLFFKLI